jgi:hypothetical protein
MIADRQQAVVEIRSLFFSLFGGAERLDCIVTQSADELANGAAIPPLFNLPLQMQALVSRPQELIDVLLDQLHGLGVWEYRLEWDEESVRVFDAVSGHLIEEGDAGALSHLQSKYECPESPGGRDLFARGGNHGLS